MLPFFFDQNTSSFKKDISTMEKEDCKHRAAYISLNSRTNYLEFKKSDLVTLLSVHDMISIGQIIDLC